MNFNKCVERAVAEYGIDASVADAKISDYLNAGDVGIEDYEESSIVMMFESLFNW